MIVLDSNIVSEFMGPPPAPSVRAWLDRQDSALLRITSVTVAEIRFGLARLPVGRRRRDLEEQFGRLLVLAFSDNVLSFDVHAAGHYAEIRAARPGAGRPISALDAQIAAIARALAATVATRNVRDFEGCGVDLVNPFEFAG